MKNSIKRAQSRAGSSFAERENQRSLAGGESNFRPKVKQLKKTLLTLVALLAVTTGAWADETPLLTIESTDYTTFTSGSMTFDDKVTVTFSNSVKNLGSNLGWYTRESSLLTVAGTNGYTITSCKFYVEIGGTAKTGYTVEGESPSVYLFDNKVYTDANDEESIGTIGVTKIEVYGTAPSAAATGPKVAWDKTAKTGKFTMPGGNVTLEPEYYPQAALTAQPTAINDVPATTDGAIVKAGTVANIGSTETAQGTVMYYVSPTALDDAALLALAADQWTADVPTAEKLTKGEAYVYYYVRGNDSDTDEENFSDGDILSANALNVTIAAEPTKVTLAANDKTMGTVEVGGESKVEWTADTWKGWTQDIKEYTVDDITMTSSQSAHIREYTSEDQYNNSLFFFVRKMVNDATVTFSTTGDPFSRIEFTMIGDYSQYNPDIIPNDNWTFEGKSAVWEGEATKSLTLQSCSTNVSKITFFKGATPDGVTVNGDGTFTVAKTATVTLKATPAEGYKFLYWEDDQTNTNPVREVTIESGMADKTYKAVFAEITYNVTFVEGTNPDPENPEWTASPATDVKKGTPVTVTYTGTKKVIGVKAEKKAKTPDPITVTWNSTNFNSSTYTQDGVTLTASNDDAVSGNCFYDYGANTFTTTLGKFTKIEIVCTSGTIDGWTKETAGKYQPNPDAHPDRWKDLYKLTWTGDAESVTIQKDVYGIQSITFTIQ